MTIVFSLFCLSYAYCYMITKDNDFTVIPICAYDSVD